MNRFLFFGISLVCFVIGLVLIFSSVSRGMEAADSYLASHGGGTDTTQYMIIVQESVNSYRWVGGILSLIGGLGFVRAFEIGPRS